VLYSTRNHPMPSFADSQAVLLPGHVFPQHQAALTIVKDRIEAPTVQTFRWLDLACGKGQILACADSVFGPSRKKIEYVGVDVNQAFAVEAQRIAEPLFKTAAVVICDLDNFEALLPGKQLFDFITFTNGAHEISPRALATTIVAALCRMERSGQLYMYDMESLSDPELGAIIWTGAEMESVMKSIMSAVGEDRYSPEAAVWPHKTCKGWSLHVNRQYMLCEPEALDGSRGQMIEVARKTIIGILQRKLVTLDTALDALRRFGATTPDERRVAVSLAYQFWAVSRALSGVARLASGKT